MRPVSAADVLQMLLPSGGWIITGDDFDSIQYDSGVSPVTKKQFVDGFDQVAAWKQQQEATKAQAKTALLEKLGITEDEAKLLLG
jgi:5'-3' exonuclease